MYIYCNSSSIGYPQNHPNQVMSMLTNRFVSSWTSCSSQLLKFCDNNAVLILEGFEDLVRKYRIAEVVFYAYSWSFVCQSITSSRDPHKWTKVIRKLRIQKHRYFLNFCCTYQKMIKVPPLKPLHQVYGLW